MTGNEKVSIPGDNVCDYCGERLDNGLEFMWRVETDQVPTFHHVVCAEAFNAALRVHFEHQFLCHKEDCDVRPKPVRWIDKQRMEQT